MAASYTAERKAATIGTASTTLTITPASNGTAGSTLILIVCSQITGASVSALSDSKSNTWFIDQIVSAASTGVVSICSCYQASALTTSDSITVTLAAAPNPGAYWLEEFAGNYSAVDQHTSATTSSATTVNTGTTAATTAADEFAVCGATVFNGSAITKSASYTNFTTGSQTLSSSYSCWYRLLTATGTQNGNGTCGSMSNNVGAIATYKAGASGSTYTKAGYAKEHG